MSYSSHISTIKRFYHSLFKLIYIFYTYTSNIMALSMKLFDGTADSPFRLSTADWDEREIIQVITPYSKGTDSSGVTADFSIEIPSCKRFKKRFSSGTKRSLFTPKRPADDDTDGTFDTVLPHKREKLTNFEESTESIIEAVDKLTTERDLVADGSRDYRLPTIPGKHSDLKSISPETLTDVMNGQYQDTIGDVTIVDCRYPYEYEGGHIKGAVNLYTKDDVYSLLQKSTTSDKPHVLIFHCEFSSERGPKMYRFLRSQDRELNKDSYPKLNFPEIYLLDGGYKAFYYAQPTTSELCQPMSYKPMLHEDHNDDLRHFRKKSKSWTAGESQKPRSRLSRRMSLCF